jgi:Ger(x)C family germination protein
LRRSGGVLLTVIAIAVLSGCWDQQLLRNQQTIDIAGFDKAPGGKLLATIAVHEVISNEKKEVTKLFSATGVTPRNNRDLLSRKVPGRLNASRLRVLLLGEELAKQNFYPVLDIFYRDPLSALSCNIALVRGKAKDMVGIKTGSILIADYIQSILESAGDLTIIPKVNIQQIHRALLSPGKDLTLPYLVTEEEEVIVKGLAMLHNKHMVGIITKDNSILYLLLSDKMGRIARLTIKVRKDKEPKIADYVTVNIHKIKRKMKVHIQGKQISVDLNLKMKVDVLEYPSDQLKNKQVIDKLNGELSEKLTKKAEMVIKKMQKVGFDGLDVSQRLAAYHPDLWKKMDWTKEYSSVRFNIHVMVSVVGSGIID